LNDIFPRIRVLIDTIHRAFNPILFLFFIILDVLLGFVIWGNIMFGASIYDFRSFTDSISTCISMVFGEVEAYYELRKVFPNSGALFFIPFMVFFVFIIVNLNRAVLNSSYGDAIDSYLKDREQQEKLKTAAESDSSGDAFTRCMKKVKGKMHSFVFGKRRAKSVIEIQYTENREKWRDALRHALKKAGMTEETAKVTDRNGTKVDVMDMENIQESSFPLRIMDKHSLQRDFKFSYPGIILYLVFLICYVAWSTLIIQVQTSNTLQRTITKSLAEPTFSKRMQGNGEVIRDNNFASITNMADVSLFLRDVLPQTMYHTSQATVENDPTKLMLYNSALPAKYKQLVINNWNVMIGQKPVRITARYFPMVEIGTMHSVTGVITADARVRRRFTDKVKGPVIMDTLAVPNFGETGNLTNNLEGNRTRNTVARHCQEGPGFFAANDIDDTGFVCMLDVDKSKTLKVLFDIEEGSFITGQTAQVAVDFVVYNAYAQAFAYVAIVFVFQPSGIIDKEISVETMTDFDLTNISALITLLLAVVVLVINFVYLAAVLGSLLLTIKKAEKCSCSAHYFRAIIRAGFQFFFVDDLFNILDFVSCVLTLVSLMLWFGFAFSPLVSNFNFPEQPLWVPGQCKTVGPWGCLDQLVIHYFALTIGSLRWCIRICAVNTIAVFFRVLKLLRPFPRMRLLMTALVRGVPDIISFVVVMSIILMGYVLLGNFLFGHSIYNFRSIAKALRGCFEMVLGTFDYHAMRTVDALAAPLYFFTYMFMFKFILMNMFLAIIDKNFQDEEKTLSDKRGVETKQGFLQKTLGKIKGIRAARKAKKKNAADAENSPGSGGTNGDAPLALTANGAPSPGEIIREPSGASVFGGDDPAKDAMPEATKRLPSVEVKEDGVKQLNWKYLPTDMKTWAMKQCQDELEFLEALDRQRSEAEATHESSELDRCLEEAETHIKNKMKDIDQAATKARQDLEEQELRQLKKVHMDQESLSYYIIKRERDLELLEKKKEMREKRYKQMIQAAESLISNPEETGGADAK